MMERAYPLSSNAGMVRLDVYEKSQKDVWSLLHNIHCKEIIPCKDLGDMLLKLGSLCDE